MIDLIASLLILSGFIFFLCGSIGLLRLPDLYSRLHALTKADNLGLGLLITGLALYQQDLLFALKLLWWVDGTRYLAQLCQRLSYRPASASTGGGLMNTSNMLLLDILLVISLLGLAWATLTTSDARRSVIFFIAFGLVLTLAWARLMAPDVALAEAAIGAGLSGALLLAAVQHKPRRAIPSEMQTHEKLHNSNWAAFKSSAAVRWIITLLCIALAFILSWALLLAISSETSESLAQSVSTNLANSGVSNPVTAVLLNFRAYDTLLELAVLLTAVLGIFALGEERTSLSACRSGV